VTTVFNQLTCKINFMDLWYSWCLENQKGEQVFVNLFYELLPIIHKV